ncbi:CRISPR-associated helicase Cas3' [Actinokineospora sp. NBRC 105648]|uniref:CRISPR-associated helicase Cas3' n=1 Tax=Actinokineospora sp. NBRC 105648 TaxID=3032206 RepID=UPI002555BE49|nr:CRISPR-associated helicase Cas3' [Actinokineospora sp. NBRC 105648]
MASVERAWLSVWAKSGHDGSSEVVGWLPLQQHLDDAAGVAARLVREWVPPLVLNRIGQDLSGTAGVEPLVVWLAAVHDVLKCSPAFACQVDALCVHMEHEGLGIDPRTVHDPGRSVVHHALAGHLVVREWLADELGFDFRHGADQVASVIGSHHGVPPERERLVQADGLRYLLGTGLWNDVREHILDRATERVGGRAVLASYKQVRFSKPTLALLTAIVIVADWIASNDTLFPLRPLPAEPEPADDRETERRLTEAMSALNLPPRWQPARFSGDADDMLARRFGRSHARPVQVAAVHAARNQAEPGLIIIEAPMGAGKTEAALLAAEVLAYRSGAAGVFLALPTQATTDAMFSRVRTWLDRLDGRLSLGLAHGKAHLNETYAGMVRTGHFESVGDPCADEGVVAHWWLSGRKKSGLASFVVGTIDQVLFAGLKSRHVMLRHLALAGKVVVIDEVHAYDVYMSQYLHRVLHWLGAYEVPVVLLSATLPHHRRTELLHAYDNGRGIATPMSSSATGYPVLSVSGGTPPVVIPMPDTRTDVRIDRLGDELDTLVSYLREHLAGGGCAAVVRNTVARVQETAERLIAEFGEDSVTIAHSRFLACDRVRIDRGLVSRFGPPTPGSARPRTHIVVASQVIEQSLDVDFDLMVTDLAPADLVLQRLGRLHRHDRERPAEVSSPRCGLVGVGDWSAAPVRGVPGSRRVYGDQLLLRAAALFHERPSISIPHDIPAIVQSAYGADALGPTTWQPAIAEATAAAEKERRERVEAAQVFLLGEATTPGSLVDWLHAGVGDVHEDSPKGTAQVRDGAESLEVLVVRQDSDGGLLTVDWIPGGGKQIPVDSMVPHNLAKVIAACSLRLPLALSHGGVIDAVIAELEQRRFPGFELSPLLKGQLVLPLDADRRARLHGYDLYYDLRRGLIHERC